MTEAADKEELAKNFYSSEYKINFSLMKAMKKRHEESHLTPSGCQSTTSVGVQTDDFAPGRSEQMASPSLSVTASSHIVSSNEETIPAAQVDFRGNLGCPGCCPDCHTGISCLIHSR